MSAVLEVLDRYPRGGDGRLMEQWVAEVERALDDDSQDWVSVVGEPGSEEFSRERAWILLAWVEGAAPRVANERRSDLVVRAAVAMALLEASPLDRRDVMVVAMLVHRGASIAGLAFASLVRAGCGRAGALGEQCLTWLPKVASATPTTHDEIHEGADVQFRRKPTGIDFKKLERWFHGHGSPSGEVRPDGA